MRRSKSTVAGGRRHYHLSKKRSKSKGVSPPTKKELSKLHFDDKHQTLSSPPTKKVLSRLHSDDKHQTLSAFFNRKRISEQYLNKVLEALDWREDMVDVAREHEADDIASSSESEGEDIEEETESFEKPTGPDDYEDDFVIPTLDGTREQIRAALRKERAERRRQKRIERKMRYFEEKKKPRRRERPEMSPRALQNPESSQYVDSGSDDIKSDSEDDEDARSDSCGSDSESQSDDELSSDADYQDIVANDEQYDMLIQEVRDLALGGKGGHFSSAFDAPRGPFDDTEVLDSPPKDRRRSIAATLSSLSKASKQFSSAVASSSSSSSTKLSSSLSSSSSSTKLSRSFSASSNLAVNYLTPRSISRSSSNSTVAQRNRSNMRRIKPTSSGVSPRAENPSTRKQASAFGERLPRLRSPTATATFAPSSRKDDVREPPKVARPHSVRQVSKADKPVHATGFIDKSVPKPSTARPHSLETRDLPSTTVRPRNSVLNMLPMSSGKQRLAPRSRTLQPKTSSKAPMYVPSATPSSLGLLPVLSTPKLNRKKAHAPLSSRAVSRSKALSHKRRMKSKALPHVTTKAWFSSVDTKSADQKLRKAPERGLAADAGGNSPAAAAAVDVPTAAAVDVPTALVASRVPANSAPSVSRHDSKGGDETAESTTPSVVRSHVAHTGADQPQALAHRAASGAPDAQAAAFSYSSDSRSQSQKFPHPLPTLQDRALNLSQLPTPESTRRSPPNTAKKKKKKRLRRRHRVNGAAQSPKASSGMSNTPISVATAKRKSAGPAGASLHSHHRSSARTNCAQPPAASRTASSTASSVDCAVSSSPFSIAKPNSEQDVEVVPMLPPSSARKALSTGAANTASTPPVRFTPRESGRASTVAPSLPVQKSPPRTSAYAGASLPITVSSPSKKRKSEPALSPLSSLVASFLPKSGNQNSKSSHSPSPAKKRRSEPTASSSSSIVRSPSRSRSTTVAQSSGKKRKSKFVAPAAPSSGRVAPASGAQSGAAHDSVAPSPAKKRKSHPLPPAHDVRRSAAHATKSNAPIAGEAHASRASALQASTRKRASSSLDTMPLSPVRREKSHPRKRLSFSTASSAQKSLRATRPPSVEQPGREVVDLTSSPRLKPRSPPVNESYESKSARESDGRTPESIKRSAARRARSSSIFTPSRTSLAPKAPKHRPTDSAISESKSSHETFRAAKPPGEPLPPYTESCEFAMPVAPPRKRLAMSKRPTAATAAPSAHQQLQQLPVTPSARAHNKSPHGSTTRETHSELARRSATDFVTPVSKTTKRHRRRRRSRSRSRTPLRTPNRAGSSLAALPLSVTPTASRNSRARSSTPAAGNARPSVSQSARKHGVKSRAHRIRSASSLPRSSLDVLACSGSSMTPMKATLACSGSSSNPTKAALACSGSSSNPTKAAHTLRTPRLPEPSSRRHLLPSPVAALSDGMGNLKIDA